MEWKSPKIIREGFLKKYQSVVFCHPSLPKVKYIVLFVDLVIYVKVTTKGIVDVADDSWVKSQLLGNMQVLPMYNIIHQSQP